MQGNKRSEREKRTAMNDFNW